jgi:hypothetical protein
MLNRLFIIIFNSIAAALAVGLFFLPLLYAEKALVPAYSARAKQLAGFRHSFKIREPRLVALLGDSTISALHPGPKSIDSDQTGFNLGAGGSVVSEWYFILRNFLREPRELGVVVLGMAFGSRLESEELVQPYSLFLLDLEDIWDFYRKGRIGLAGALTLTQQHFLDIAHTRDEVLHELVTQHFPLMRKLMQSAAETQAERAAKAWEQQNPGSKVGDHFHLEQLLELAKGRGLEVVFVKSPVHSETRASEMFQEDEEVFRNLCKRFAVRCKDLSASMGDEVFHEDKVHLRFHHLYRYRTLIYHYLIQEGLLRELYDDEPLEET